MRITRRVEFSASHRLYSEALTPAENLAVYGSESNASGHGHNYILEVTLDGEPDATTGMIIDLKDVKRILEAEVLVPLDHRHLNHEVDPFGEIVPTTENLAIEIWRRLERSFDGTAARLSAVRVYETEDLWVEYAGA